MQLFLRSATVSGPAAWVLPVLLAAAAVLLATECGAARSKEARSKEAKGKAKPAPVRLVGGEHPWEGRLEVYYRRRREYGTVCDDGWHMNASHVACRMLGYAEAEDFHYGHVFGPGTGLILLDDVKCTGNESSLFACAHAKLGESNCGHSEDVGLSCSQDTPEDRQAAQRAAVSIRRSKVKIRKDRRQIRVRLAGKSKLQPRSSGVVELLYKNKWRTVCGRGWDRQDARVVCGMLGFKDSLPLADNYEESDTFQRRKAVKFIDFGCTGAEVSIGTCPFDDLKVAGDCPMDTPVAHVHCHRGDFVLDTPYDENGLPVVTEFSVDDEDETEAGEEADNTLEAGGGYQEAAEVEEQEKEGAVTEGGGEERAEATTAAAAAAAAADVDAGPGPNITAELAPEAEGATEATDTTKPLEGEARRRKGKSKVKSTARTTQRVRIKKPKLPIRLKSGANHGEGRVEVFINNYWGTVCSEGWDLVDASVACRHLGFGVAKEIIPNAGFGQGVGPIWLWRMRCEGHEKTLSDCSHGYLNGSTCTHGMDAGVRCTIPDLNVTSKVRLEGGTYEKEGRVAIYSSGYWWNICGMGWNLLAARVVCRQLGMGHARYALESSLGYGAAPKRDFRMMDVECTGHERTLRECKYTRLSSSDQCFRGFRAGVVCVDTLSDVLMDLHVLQSSVRVQDWPESLMTCSREEGCLSNAPNNWGMRRLLRFTSAIMNRGMEQFRPFLSRYSWIWHSCHQHYHSMEVFSHYDLVNQKGERVAEGHKASFCLEDGHCDDGILPQFSCNTDQGISVNCIDIYASNIDCQWVDITGIKADLYKLRIHINPENIVAESDYDNNLIECDLYYGGSAVMIGHCEYVHDRMTDD